VKTSNIAILSCNGGTVTHGTGPAEILKVATIEGLVTLRRRGPGDWVNEGAVLTDIHVSAVLWEPRAGLLFAGGHLDGGLWVSTAQGGTWSPCMDGIKHDNIYSIAAQHRGAETVLFVGTEPAELYRSDDLGRSWHELSSMRSVPNTHLWNFPPPPHIAHCKNVSWHPANLTTYYVCVEQGALLRTEDDGASWIELEGYEDVAKDKFRHDVHRVLITPSNPNQLLLVTGEGCYISTDAGDHFEKVTDRFYRIAYPDASFIDPRNESVIYMGGPNDSPVGWGADRCAYATVMRSTDGGRSWTEHNRGMPDPIRGNIEAMGLYHYGDQVTLFAGTATGEVYVSEDAGENWVCAAAGLPPISKAQHYRWFLSPEEKLVIETKMKARIRKPAGAKLAVPDATVA
jgi:photosystem II stability/assembly factor-like uncharacterized protein